MKVALAGPYPPPFAGMSVLCTTLNNSLEAFGLEVIALNTNVNFSVLRGFSLLNRLLQFPVFLFELRKILFVDVVLIVSSSGTYLYLKAFPILVISKVLKKQVILDFVGGKGLDKLKGDKSIFIRLLNKFDKILVPSSPFQKALKGVGIQSIIMPHIVDIERFFEKNPKDSGLRLLAVKSLVDYSNVRSLILAYSKIKSKYPESEFVIAGDGNQRIFLEKLVEDMGLSGVKFIGNVAYEKMPELFQHATVFVHGTKYESFGIVIVEALASGTPVISTNVGGIPDIIENGANGFLVEYDDHDAMADRILEVHENRDLCKTLHVNGLLSSKKYSREVLTPQLINILSGLENG